MPKTDASHPEAFSLQPLGFARALVFAWAILLLLCSFRSQPPAGDAAAEASPPNLLLVLTDQWRGSALGFLGKEPVKTPRLDRFAEQSLVLTNAVANAPVCSPSRAMLMTGQYPVRNSVLVNANSDSAPYGNQLQASARTWSDVLGDQGYSLGYIGKWHLEAPFPPYVESYNNEGDKKWNEWIPPDRRHGFDFWYAYNTYDRHLHPMYWATDTPRDSAFIVDEWSPQHEADKAIAYLRNEQGRYRDAQAPFALVVSMNPPHAPYDAVPPRYVDRYAKASPDELVTLESVPSTGTKWGRYARKHIKHYFAMMTGVDEQFGRILDALEQEGLSQNTLVLFTSDHGNCLGAHGEVSKNVVYDCAMVVPFLLRYPGVVAPRRDSLLLSMPDVYPTLLDLMGMNAAIPEDVQGQSLASIFRTGRGERPKSQLYMRYAYGRPAEGERGLRTHRYTLLAVPPDPEKPLHLEYRLYDNKRDPYQLRNIAPEQPETLQELRRRLNRWLGAIYDPWRYHMRSAR